MNRVNKILLGALVAQLALLVLVWTSTGDSAPAKPQPVLAGFDVAKVTRLQVFPSKTDESGATASPPVTPLDLVKRGQDWVVASSHDYPARPGAVVELLGKLGGLTHAGTIARGAARAKQLEVADDDYQRKLVVTADGKDVTVLLGGPIGGRQTALRVSPGPEVVAVSGLSAWAVDPALRSWVSPTYGEVARERISQVLVQRDGQDLQVAKDGAQWKVSLGGAPVALAAGEVIDAAAIDEVLGQVSMVELTSVADKKLTEGKPLATISVWASDPTSTPAAGSPSRGAAPAGASAAGASVAPAMVLTVFEHQGNYVVERRGASHAVVVDGHRLRATVELSRAKLVKKESKPAAVAAPAPAGAPLSPEQIPGLTRP